MSLANPLIALALRIVRVRQGLRIAAAKKHPLRAQHATLMAIVRRNAGTAFGRQYGFGQINCYEDFAQHVPIGDYESLRSFVESEINDGLPALTTDPPLFYARTSGTTGRPKDLPITGSYLTALRKINRTAVSFQHRLCPDAFEGDILVIHGAAREGLLPNSKSYGAASGLVDRKSVV